jgi:hypothetical protein
MMNILRRLLGQLLSKPVSVPPWASFFTPPQYQCFVGHVENHFRRQQQKFTLKDGVVLLDRPPAEGFQQHGLANLAQLCYRNEEKDWADIIAEHFRTLRKSHAEQSLLETRLDDFERVRELLAVRLWPVDYLPELSRDRFIRRHDLPGTLTALVFDLPSSVRNVTPEEARRWGKSPEELFEIGLTNVRENCIPDASEQDLGDGVTVSLLSDESFFVASHALLLEDRPECLGAFGALVGVPHRHVLLTYAIEDLGVLHAINLLVPIIMGMEKEGPGSISSCLYWYKDGKFTDLPYHVKNKVLHFDPPEEFVDVLNLLGEPGG